MWFLQILILFAVYSVGPGLFFLRRTGLAAGEKLVASIGLSYVFVYLLAFAVYLLKLPTRAHLGVSLLCLALTLFSLRDLWRLVQLRHVRRMLGAYGLFLVWAVLLLSFVRHYGGGTWSGDWLEQYQRTIFFLNHRPADTLMIGLYPLPARPSMMNHVAASFLAQAGPQYDVFQLVYVYLNSLVFLPAYLVARNLIRRPARRLPWVLLLILAASPMVAQNLTYTWSKLFTAFYVLLGTHLYLRGWRKGRTLYMVLAFAGLSAGFIVHHSAGPYALFFGLHYAVAVFWRRRNRWAEAAAVGAVSLLLLATWFGWTSATYGGKRAFGSTSTVTDSAVMTPRENALNIGKNVLNTIVPRVIQNPAAVMNMEELRDGSPLSKTRDFAFLVYQVSLTFGLGSLGAVAVALLIRRTWRAPERARHGSDAAAGTTGPQRERRFWLGFALTVFVVGVAVYGGVDRFGVAHICLQALVLVGLALIAAGFRHLPAGFRWVVVAGLVLDLFFGILVHVTMESRDFMVVEGPDGRVGIWSGEPIAHAPQGNWLNKMAPAATLINPEQKQNADPNFRGDTDPIWQSPLPYWGDQFAGLLPVLQGALVGMFALFAWLALQPAGPPQAGRAGGSPAPSAPKKVVRQGVRRGAKRR